MGMDPLSFAGIRILFLFIRSRLFRDLSFYGVQDLFHVPFSVADPYAEDHGADASQKCQEHAADDIGDVPLRGTEGKVAQ